VDLQDESVEALERHVIEAVDQILLDEQLSQNQKILWSKLSEGFVRWIRKGEVRENSFAAQYYRKQSVPDQLAPVPASACLHEKGLREGAQIWEQSMGLNRYGAVLSLLVIIEAVEKRRSRRLPTFVRLWLGQFNWPDRLGQINQVVRIPGTAKVAVRQRGPRSLDEIPQLEIRTVQEMLQNGTSTPDQAALGRVTAQIRKQFLG
jgi:hypothetical protein